MSGFVLGQMSVSSADPIPVGEIDYWQGIEEGIEVIISEDLPEIRTAYINKDIEEVNISAQQLKKDAEVLCSQAEGLKKGGGRR